MGKRLKFTREKNYCSWNCRHKIRIQIATCLSKFTFFSKCKSSLGSFNIIIRRNIKIFFYIFLVLDYEEVSNPSSLSGESSSIYISETELVLINELVEISDFRETSKVNDMDTTLIREIIR